MNLVGPGVGILATRKSVGFVFVPAWLATKSKPSITITSIQWKSVCMIRLSAHYLE